MSEISEKASLILKALANKSIEAKCVRCETMEYLIELDDPLDEVFLANYYCEKCDQDADR